VKEGTVGRHSVLMGEGGKGRERAEKGGKGRGSASDEGGHSVLMGEAPLIRGKRADTQF
jgi:hypothetical protein